MRLGDITIRVSSNGAVVDMILEHYSVGPTANQKVTKKEQKIPELPPSTISAAAPLRGPTGAHLGPDMGPVTVQTAHTPRDPSLAVRGRCRLPICEMLVLTWSFGSSGLSNIGLKRCACFL